MSSIENILKFTKTLDAFRAVERAAYVPRTGRLENDIEHCYMLAMLAWYIIETDGLELDVDKVMRYALIHDLVEVHAGDTPVFSSSHTQLQNKAKREEEALQRLKEEYGEFPDLFEWIETYEKRDDKESKFVYALDKLQPMLHIYLDGGRTWREEAVTLSRLVDHKKGKVDVSPEVERYLKELVDILKKDEAKLFGKYLSDVI